MTMAEPRNHRLVLTGPYAGRTMNLKGHQFVEGVLELHGTMEAVEGLVVYMGRSFQAFLEGSDELRAAQERDKEAADGQRNSSREVQPEGDEGEGHVQPEGEGAPAPSDDHGNGAGEAPEGTGTDVSGGNGQSDAGVPERAPEQGGAGEAQPVTPTDTALLKAIHGLDPENDDHWTEDGLPLMTAVETSYGSAGITRKDVEAAAPEWNRDKAREQKELDALNS